MNGAASADAGDGPLAQAVWKQERAGGELPSRLSRERRTARSHFPVLVPPRAKFARRTTSLFPLDLPSNTNGLGNGKKRCTEADQIAGEDGNREINVAASWRRCF